jgi:hypothetical protein
MRNTKQVAQQMPSVATLKPFATAMQQRWYELIQAEAHHQSDAVLERLFAAYMTALEAYVAANHALAAPRRRVA